MIGRCWQPIAAAVVFAIGCPDGGGAGHDATPEDGGLDGGREPRPRDGGVPPPDGPSDAGVVEPRCDLGQPCTATRGCAVASACIEESSGTIGGPEDPIVGHPDGATAVPTRMWIDGYCTEVGNPDDDGCDPDADESCPCGVCLDLGRDATGLPLTLCAAGCTPSITENDCREGYRCLLGTDACLPGCSSDDECAIRRTEEGLVYDGEGMWTCNSTTYRCEHVPPEGAEAGVPCDRDAQCELYGRCLEEVYFPRWQGGYCVKSGCDVPGNACAGDGVCDSRAFGDATCLAPCEVAATDPAGDPFAPSRDCRAGYACAWGGSAGAGVDNGVCVPGNYNGVRVANVGASCDASGDAAECYSPFGLGTCRDWDGSDGPAAGYCTLFDCAAPGLDSETICGMDAVCAGVSGRDTTLCLETCESAADCGAGLGCWDTTSAGISTGGRSVCFAGCLEDGHCRSGESCVVSTGAVTGVCAPE